MEPPSPMQALVRLESLYFPKSEESDNVDSAVGWNYSISSQTQPGYIVYSSVSSQTSSCYLLSSSPLFFFTKTLKMSLI